MFKEEKEKRPLKKLKKLKKQKKKSSVKKTRKKTDKKRKRKRNEENPNDFLTFNYKHLCKIKSFIQHVQKDFIVLYISDLYNLPNNTGP